MRSIGTSYLLWFACFLGLCGVHRFYNGKWITGLIWLYSAVRATGHSGRAEPAILPPADAVD